MRETPWLRLLRTWHGRYRMTIHWEVNRTENVRRANDRIAVFPNWGASQARPLLADAYYSGSSTAPGDEDRQARCPDRPFR